MDEQRSTFMIKKRQRLYTRYKRTRNHDHYNICQIVNREVNIQISKANEDHKQKLIHRLESQSTTSKQYWNIYKQITGSKIEDGIPTLIDNDRQYTSSGDKANLLATYFASQSQVPQQADNNILEQMPERSTLTMMEVTESQVLSILMKLNVHKATGSDGLSIKLLKSIARAITPSLTSLYNKCLSEKTFPTIWKKANITPVYKKGPRGRPTTNPYHYSQQSQKCLKD